MNRTAEGKRCALLDVNILMALAWPNHAHHTKARTWFDNHHRAGWATTPVTEAGFVRISSNRAAIGMSTTPKIALELLRKMIELDGHTFWIDDIPAVTGKVGDPDLLVSHRDITDAHLLALAHRHGGKLVTFDGSMRRLLRPDELELIDVQT